MRHNGAVMRAVLLPAPPGSAVMRPAGGGDGEGEAPPADEIVAKAAAAAGGLRSFHFRLDHENGTTPILMGLELVSAEGEVAPPDRLQAEVRAKAMGSVSVTVNVVGIGERAWVTNPFTRQWQGERDGRLRGHAAPPSFCPPGTRAPCSSSSPGWACSSPPTTRPRSSPSCRR